jgi:diguanylate cyclase (GGDEF)-like protein
VGILIVDDHRDTCETLAQLLEAGGYSNVRTALSGWDALFTLRDPKAPAINLIITDLAMPGLSGIDVCRELKADPALRDIPVLMVTGIADEGLIERAFSAGAHDFIPKPCHPGELLARVRAALRLKQELDRRKERERELLELTERFRGRNEELRQLAVLDDLTGIPNRRAFNLIYRQEWARCAREGASLAVILSDVDWFKAFNDTYGHQQGDDCLTRVGTALLDPVRRAGDFVARYGGEEFVVLLPSTDADGALAIAEALRRSVEGLNLNHATSAYGRVTMSFGLAVAVPDSAGDSADLIAAADGALYRAKARGRNQVVTADDGPISFPGSDPGLTEKACYR